MKTETRKLAEIIPYARNPRKNLAAIDKVAASLKEFGWQQPMVVDREGVLIVGHTRREAALKLGWTVGPVVVADKLTPQQVKAYRLSDNRTGEEAEWDRDLLKLEIEELQFGGFDLGLTAFGDEELGALLLGEAGAEPGAETPAADAVDEGPGDPGEERYSEQYAVIVMCNDAAHQEAVFNELQAAGHTVKVVNT